MREIGLTVLFGAEQPSDLISRYLQRCCNFYKDDKENINTSLFLWQDQ
jgi:hypothetical protein